MWGTPRLPALDRKGVARGIPILAYEKSNEPITTLRVSRNICERTWNLSIIL